MLKELGITTDAQYSSGDKMQRTTQGGQVLKFKGEGLRTSVIGSTDVLNRFREIENLAKKVTATDPTADSQAANWNRMSVAEYADSVGWTQNRVALDTLCSILFDAKPQQINMLYFLMFLNSAGGSFDTLTLDQSHGAYANTISNGSMHLVDAMARSVGDVRQYRQVTRLRTLGDHVEVETKEGDIKRARYVVVAVPPNKAAEIRFQPPLSEEKVQLLHNFAPKGKGLKFVFTYPKAWWRPDLAGQVLSTVQTDGTQTEPPMPSMLTYDTVTSRGTPALTGLAGFTSDHSQEVRRQAYLAVLEPFFGDNVTHFLGFSDKDWSKDAYSHGAMAIVGPGKMPARNFSSLIRGQTNERIIWAGTETAIYGMGYMDGAVQAGRRAAGEVLDKYKIKHSLFEPLNHSATLYLSKTLFALVTVFSLLSLFN